MIHEGKKTETRRIWKKQRAIIGSVHLMKIKMLSKENFGKMKITNIIKNHLLDITEEGAQREGGYTREEYLKLWFKINPKSPKNPEVFVVNFEDIKADPNQPQ
jgi:hypothetical protein